MSEKKAKTLLERAKEDEEKETQDFVKSLSIRERLMGRVQKVVVPIEFEDQQGKFTVKCRAISSKDQTKLMRLQEKLQNVKSTDEYEAFIEELLGFIAYPDGVCLEPELTLDWWKQGNYVYSDFLKIVSSIISANLERLKEVRSFRDQ